MTEKCWSKNPANSYLFRVNNGNLRKRFELYSKSRVKKTEQRQWRRFGVFIVNFEHISSLFLMFL